MDTPVSLAYKLIGVVVFVAGIFTAGYFSGWKYTHDNLVSFRAQVDQLASDQIKANKQKELDQDEKTKAIQSDYLNERTALFANLDRMRQQSKNGSGMSSIAIHPQGTNESTSEFGSTCTRYFYEAGLNDALQLKSFQDWVIRQHIPVK